MAHRNWLYPILFLVIISLFLAACERPLPGGYNEPGADLEPVPVVPESVPEVDPGAYPAEGEVPAPEAVLPEDAGAYPAADDAPVEEAPPADSGVEDTGEQDAPTGDEAAVEESAPVEVQPEAEAPAEEASTTDEAAAADQSAGEEPAATPGTHTVAVGENLYRIGLLYGINWLDLAAANDISDPANLSVGQVLVIPSADDSAEEAVEETTEAVEADAAVEAEAEVEAEAVEEAEEAEEVEAALPEESETAETGEAEGAALPTTYIVQQGDNLFRIGVNFGVDWNEIVAANDIIGLQIYPGQELIIPVPAGADAGAEAASEVPAPAAIGEEATYEVQKGDSVYSIAFEHNIAWMALVEANDIEAPFTLEVGQVLAIPDAE